MYTDAAPLPVRIATDRLATIGRIVSFILTGALLYVVWGMVKGGSSGGLGSHRLYGNVRKIKGVYPVRARGGICVSGNYAETMRKLYDTV